MQESPRHFWVREATGLRRLLNMGLFLDAARFWIVPIGLAGAVCAIFARVFGSSHLAWSLAAVSILVPLLVAACLAWKRRFSLADALLRLDVLLRLDTRLTVAHTGVSEWPQPVAVPRSLVFRKERRSLIPVCVVSILACAVFIPLPEAEPVKGAVVPDVLPSAWKTLEDWVATLDELDLVHPTSIETWEARVADLSSQPPEEWHSTHSLEAGLHMQKQLRAMATEFAANMMAASGQLESAGAGQFEGRQQMDAAGQADAWQQLVDELAMGTLPLRQDLAEKLRAMGGSGDLSMDQDLLRQMQERLSKGAETIADTFSLSDADLMPWDGPLQDPGAPGNGLPERGPGHLPLLLDLAAGSFPAEQSARIETEVDFERALPGDTLSVSMAGSPEAADFDGASTGGGTEWSSRGSDARLPANIRPSEAKIVERYFSR